MPSAADACVIWLHGEGESGRAWEFLENDAMFGLGVRLPWVNWSFPNAPDKLWFTVEMPVIDASREAADLDNALRTVHAMLSQVEDTGIPAARILLGGFGQGAALALLAGRTYPRTLAGIASLSGWYLRPRERSSEAGGSTPILLCHGEEDDDVPFDHYTEACARIRRDGVDLTCFGYSGLSHHDCAKELTVLAAPKNFITDRLRTLTPKPAPPRTGRPSAAATIDAPLCKLDEPLFRRDAEQGASEPGTATGCRVDSMRVEDATLHVLLTLDNVTSLSDASLSIGPTQLELILPGAAVPFVLRFPCTVDADSQGNAKFSKKTHQLRLALSIAHS